MYLEQSKQKYKSQIGKVNIPTLLNAGFVIGCKFKSILTDTDQLTRTWVSVANVAAQFLAF